MRRLIIFFSIISLFNFWGCAEDDEGSYGTVIDVDTRPIDVVSRVFIKYHMSADNIIDVDFTGNPETGLQLNLELRSERNNFHRDIIIAFAAAGKVVEQTPNYVIDVNIVIVIRYKHDTRLLAYASGEAVQNFSKGEISFDQFLSEYVSWEDL